MEPLAEGIVLIDVAKRTDEVLLATWARLKEWEVDVECGMKPIPSTIAVAIRDLEDIRALRNQASVS